MTTIELATLIATYALAASRLLRVTQPLWARLPHVLQLALPVILIALPQMGNALGMVETKLELTEAIGHAVIAVLVAVGGQPGSAAKPVAGLALVLSLGATACTGSLESARASARSARAASSPERCTALDDRRQLAGAIGKGAAALAGVSGLATIPIEDDDKALRYGLAGGAVVAGAIAAGAMVVAEGATESWGRECSGR